jgi:hypothetical protein
MTPDDFRRIALSMPEATEVYRWEHSEFRVERRTFASLGAPADAVATLNLTSEQQAVFQDSAPRVFEPVPGGWGRLGSTNVLLAWAEELTVESAVEAAWRNVVPKSPSNKKNESTSPRRKTVWFEEAQQRALEDPEQVMTGRAGSGILLAVEGL